MLTVSEALSLIREYCRPLSAERFPLSSAALGRVLAESIASDLDSPPFDKALMDGYAVRSADLPTGKGTVRVIEEIVAGQSPQLALEAGQASRIMTGAPLPQGADAVVIIERTRLLDGGKVEIDDRPPRPGQNLLRRGREMAAGEVVLQAGTVLRPQEFGILASVGRTAVWQIPPPRVAILSTGDELVEPAMSPGPGQIRNSNAPMLLAQTASAGGLPRYLGIAGDSLDSLRPMVREGLETAQVLVLSGGVSAGKLDLVPDVLREAGVVAHFHKVHLKPGKPLFFGTCEVAGEKRVVFGLPGNPVSSFVCFELFIRPAIRRLAGHGEFERTCLQARFSESFQHQSDRPTYYPAWIEPAASGWYVKAVPWLGSADLRAFLKANALLVLPPGPQRWQTGDAVDVMKLDG
jgi:molybdopterin molybdotransferase